MADGYLSNQELALQIQNYWQNLDEDRQEYKDWVSGSITGGPNGDGKYPLTDFTGNVQLVPCPARTVYDANAITQAPVLTGAGPHTIGDAHYNKKVMINSANLITLNLPNTAPLGASVIVRGIGASIKCVPTGGAQLRNWQQHNGSAGSLALISLSVEANPGGSSAVWTLDGSTAQL